MHQLWTLIWKSLRIRQRSLTSTLIDLFAPLAVIIVYLLFKIFLVGDTFENTDSILYARDHDLLRTNKTNINFAKDLPKYFCTQILYDYKKEKNIYYRPHSSPGPSHLSRLSKQTLDRNNNSHPKSHTQQKQKDATTHTQTTYLKSSQNITNRRDEIVADNEKFMHSDETLFKKEVEAYCGVTLLDIIEMGPNSSSVKSSLDRVLNLRKLHRDDRLSQSYSQMNTPSTDGCFHLNNQTLYQAGIELKTLDLGPLSNETILLDFKLYFTDSLTNNIIHMPFELAHLHREYIYPYGSVGSGHGMMESCLIGAMAKIYRRRNSDIRLPALRKEPPHRHSLMEGFSFMEQSNGSNIRPQSSLTTTTITNNKKPPPPLTTTTTTTTPTNNFVNGLDGDIILKIGNLPEVISWSVKADPIWADPQQAPILFMLLSIVAYTINGAYILIRITDDIQMGVYQYLRMSGVSALVYWSSHFITTMIHLTIQDFIISIMLSMPINSQFFDPIYDMSFGIKFYLLWSWSFVFTLHLLAAASFFNKTTHAIVIFGLLYASWNFYPLLFLTSWGPACITPYLAQTILLIMPNSLYTTTLVVISGIAMKTGEPFEWRHTAMILPNAGMFQYSIVQLWLIQIIQAIFWTSLIIVKDRHLMSTDRLYPTLKCCICETLWAPVTCLFDKGVTPMSDKPASRLDKVSPNCRVACSLRQVTIDGVQLKVANIDRLNALFRDKSQSDLDKNVTKMNYIVNHKTRKSLPGHEQSLKSPIGGEKSFLAGSEMTKMMGPISPEQLIWQHKKNGLKDLSIDFSFNQISYIIGAVRLKELLFATILGCRTPDSGKVIIDNREYPTSVRDQFRRQIGYLGERDIFFVNMSSFENLQFFGSIRDPNYRTYDSESNYVLSLLHLTSRKDSPPDVLTIRSQRKLSLAVAIVGHTKVLLLVEPTLGLRWKPRCQVLNLLRKYKTIRSILIDTNDVDEAVTCGDKIVLLRDEKIEFDDAPHKLRQQLRCGYRIRFSPMKKHKINLAGLEKFVGSVFGEDKMGSLEKWTNSLNGEASCQQKSLLTVTNKSDSTGANNKSVATNVSFNNRAKINLTKDSLMLSVRPGANCIRGIQNLMNKFYHSSLQMSSQSGSGISDGGADSFGVKISLIDFESLEDMIVARIGFQNYPELPPDLLASMSMKSWQSAQRESRSKFLVEGAIMDLSLNPLSIMKDRFFGPDIRHIALLSLFLPLILAGVCLYVASIKHLLHDNEKLDPYAVTRLYKERVGFFTYDSSNFTSPNRLATELVELWPGHDNVKRVLASEYIRNNNDTYIIEESIRRSRSLLVSSIYLDVKTGQATILYGSGLPHSLIAAIRMFGQFLLAITSARFTMFGSSDRNVDNTKLFESSFRSDFQEFHHEWHEILNGLITRRYYYAVGFGLAEGIAIGSMVLTPGRHRAEARVIKTRINYWISMGVCDLFISCLLNIGYLTLFILVENISNRRTILITFAILTLYKLAALPVAYLTSLVIGRRWLAFMFILLVSIVINWDFGIIINTFIDYTLIYRAVEYQTTKWLINMFPINALVHILTTIGHLELINRMCTKVPAFIKLFGVYHIDPRSGIADPAKLSHMGESLQKVEECLRSGKTSVNTDFMHGDALGILWNIYIVLIFAIIAWLFLLLSEQAFGLVARRTSTREKDSDQVRSANRTHSPPSGRHRWLKDRGRLVGEYNRCMYEKRYTNLMTRNCFFIRIWFKPMAEKRLIDECQDLVTRPLIEGGQPREDIKIELQTTLQMFIRVGSSARLHRLDRSHLLDAYSNLLRKYNETLNGFAIVDWSREMLYKLLLHGHYNAKSTNA